jgi:hypothetical protein
MEPVHKKSKFDERWREKFDELAEFFQKHGHSHVPFAVPKLGPWVCEQRKKWIDLAEERREKLKALRFEPDFVGYNKFLNFEHLAKLEAAPPTGQDLYSGRVVESRPLQHFARIDIYKRFYKKFTVNCL